jgi:DNA uptake protein ComE-like DNA-binding protein
MIRNVLLAAAFLLAAPAFAETPAVKTGGPDPVPPAMTHAPTGPQAVAPSAKMAGEAQRLDLNSATLEQLASVKGFDKTIAEAIVKGRPFKSVEDLTARKIVSGDVFATVKDRFIVR